MRFTYSSMVTAALAATLINGLPTSTDSNIARSPNSPGLAVDGLPSGSSAAQRVKTRYGPFTVPGMNDSGGMKNFFVRNATQPCSDCVITYIHAGLEYPNGSYANANTGMWLHHALLYNLNKTDTTCPQFPERFFASGNERTPLDLTLNGTTQAGYYVGANDTVALTLELMNEVAEARDAFLVLEWEYVSGPPAPALRRATPIWLDITGACSPNGAEVTPPAGNRTFSLDMADPWTSTAAGDVINAVGHLHDGGMDLAIIRNGETVCDSKAAYGESEGYVQTTEMDMGGGMMMDMKMLHISSMSGCSNVSTAAGDKWSVRANYDFKRHEGMMDGGKLAGVMGIALLYVAWEEDASA